MKRTYNSDFAWTAARYEREAVKIIESNLKIDNFKVVHNSENSWDNKVRHSDIDVYFDNKRISIDIKGKSEDDCATPNRWLCTLYSLQPTNKTWLYRGADYIGFFTLTELLLVKRDVLAKFADNHKELWRMSKFGDKDYVCPITVTQLKAMINNKNVGYILKRNV